MNNKIDIKSNIEIAIHNFQSKSLIDSSLNLFSELGYNTNLNKVAEQYSYTEFKSLFIDSSPNKENFHEDNVVHADWNNISILFQLTDQCFSTKQPFSSSTNLLEKQSYLFFSLDLKKENYDTKTIINITREINKIFPIPIFLITKYGRCITLSVINRRYNKKNVSKDVLEKVTLIKDIDIENVSRAHIEILNDISFYSIQKNYKVCNFETLHKAWSEILNTKLLNQRFYNELSNWFFWAQNECIYPKVETSLTDNEYKADNLIRLISRLLFIWFIKERNLIPNEIFDAEKIKECFIDNFISTDGSTLYYKVILQNLFFAVLNKEIPERCFSNEVNDFDNTFMHYKSLFSSEKKAFKFLELMNKTVPFINGGLFECLDQYDENHQIINFFDGFSEDQKNNISIPNYLFFSPGTKVNISNYFEGDTKKKKTNVEVRGLIQILRSYKFTITENTPLEEDIALDPELLGRVFENLLAAYNPETKKTVRKCTGSYFTPREIVNYMTDESIKNYLKNIFTGSPNENIDSRLNSLIEYNEGNIQFSDKEREKIVISILNCKILDPACGSGAFPLGIIQKFVYILQKIDPSNEIWLKVNKDRFESMYKTYDSIDNTKMLSINEKTYFNNKDINPDYLRKLFLLENCIHGIDIQPIAIQLSKLRCFISLLVDEKLNSQKENFGVIPLPNLGFKFICANSLVDLRKKDKLQCSIYNSEKLQHLQNEKIAIKYLLFLTQSIQDKRILINMYKEIISKISCQLKDTNSNFLSWDPFLKNNSSSWFDSEWMFDLRNSFDIIIGNPPYMRIQEVQNNEHNLKNYYEERFPNSTGDGASDLANIFFERALEFVADNGICTYIFPHKFLNSEGAGTFRNWLQQGGYIKKISHFGANQIFKDVNTYTCITEFSKCKADGFMLYKAVFNADYLNEMTYSNNYNYISYKLLSDASKLYGKNNWIMFPKSEYFEVFKKLYTGKFLKDILSELFVGIQTSKDELYLFTKVSDTEYELQMNNKIYNLEEQYIRPFLKGKDVHRWQNLKTDKYVFFPYDIEKGIAKPVPLTKLKNEFPNTYKYLLENEDIFKSRENGKAASLEHWYRFLRENNLNKFDQEKLTSMEICIDHPNVTINRDRLYHTTKAYSWVRKDNIVENYEYILALANSPIIWWFIKLTGDTLQGDARTFKTEYLYSFPIPNNITQKTVTVISDLVNAILTKKSIDYKNDTTVEENNLNNKLYDLYGLNEADIKIIENANKM